jgi:kynurenine formamidase
VKIVDLSQTLINRMQVYPGDVPPMLYQTHYLAFDDHTDFQLTLGMHTGTHIDGPLHLVKDKPLLCDVPLDSFIGKGCVIDISNTKVFDDCTLVKDKAAGCNAVLFHTGFSAFFGTPQYLNDYPLVSAKVAQTLVDLGVRLFGIDTLSPDDSPYYTHKILLGNGIVITENLTNLDQLLNVKEFTLIALPLKIQADSAPARVVAVINN